MKLLYQSTEITAVWPNNPSQEVESVTSSVQHNLKQRLEQVEQRIRTAAALYGRVADDIQLLAVSKTRSDRELLACAELGQRMFGESYLQEALSKIEALKGQNLEWHFIGRIQSNKTRPIAEHFAWVHSLASLKHAQRLSSQRPTGLPPLKVCIQVNTSGESSKDGHTGEELVNLIDAYASLPNIEIRGLMTIPAPAETLEQQRLPFRRLRELRDSLRRHELPLETLSMGMSQDLEAAIAEGANLLRVGTAIFGPRQYNVKN